MGRHPRRGAPMANVKPIPDGYPQVTPYLAVDDANAANDFYTTVFGARERMRMDAPGGKVGHAELQFGDSLVMLADEFPEMGNRSPRSVGGTPVTISVYVDDVDAAFDRALRAGAKELRPLENQFYGDRTAQIEDPFGHRWSISTHIEDVPPDEMQRRAAEMAQRMSEGSGCRSGLGGAPHRPSARELTSRRRIPRVTRKSDDWVTARSVAHSPGRCS